MLGLIKRPQRFQPQMQNYDKEYPQHLRPENAGGKNQNSAPPPRSKEHRAAWGKKVPLPPNAKKTNSFNENWTYQSLREYHHFQFYSSKNFYWILLAFLCVFLFCFLVAKWKAETAPVKPKPDGQAMQNHNPLE